MFERFTKTTMDENPREQSTRRYEGSPELITIGKTEPIVEQFITPESDILVIGDGQGSDTKRLLIDHRVSPTRMHSINYEMSEVEQANETALQEWPIKMTQGDATNLESLHAAGVKDESKDIVIMMHVLETPAIRGEIEKMLVEHIARVLKPGGEALLTQYIRRLTPEQAQRLNVMEIHEQDLFTKYGSSWRERFKADTGKTWVPGMRFSELSNIRTKEQLTRLFEPWFHVRIDQNNESFVIRLKKK